MAWSIPTYAGTYMGGSPSAARTAMFELCRAVNEREAALDLTKTQFYKANGALASDVASADFANASLLVGKQNLKKVRDAIKVFIGDGFGLTSYFTESSGYSTSWTKANLEAAIGTDIDADPIRPQEARYWQAMQDALDLLIYARRTVVGSSSTATAYAKGNEPGNPTPGGTGFSPSDAWSNMLADGAFSDGPPTSFGLSFRINVNLPSYSARARYRVEDVSYTNAFQGVLQDISYTLGTSYINLGTDVEIAVGSATFYALSHSSGAGFETLASSLDLALDTTSTLACEFTSIPGSHPFTTDASTSNSYVEMGFAPLANYYFDIAAELTDQAA